MTKTRVWCPDGDHRGLPEYCTGVVEALPCLGSTVSFVRAAAVEADEDWRDVTAGIHDHRAPAESAHLLRAYGDNLDRLRQGGLETQHCFTLLRTFVNGAATHHQRARVAPEGAWTSYDDEVMRSLVG